MRRTVFVVSILAAMASSAAAEDQARDKLCIFSAAQKLPPVKGMEINKSRITQRSGSQLTGEIDIHAAGQDATFGFTCISAANGYLNTVITGLVK